MFFVAEFTASISGRNETHTTLAHDLIKQLLGKHLLFVSLSTKSEF